LRETWKIQRNPKRIFSRPNGQPISGNSLATAIKAAREQCHVWFVLKIRNHTAAYQNVTYH